MGPRRWRLGIRPQLTIIVLLAAVLSTVATLFVTESAVKSYVETQARDQEQQHMKIAKLVLTANFGQNVSISSDKYMVVDSPSATSSFGPQAATGQSPFGKYRLNGDTDYVDLVQQLISGMVSVYQCADEAGNAIDPCMRISTTFRAHSSSTSSTAPREVGVPLEAQAIQNLHLASAVVGSDAKVRRWSAVPQEWSDTSPVTIDGTPYISDYSPILNPQGQMIGVVYVGVPYDAVTSVVANTTIELVIIGTIIMVVGVLLAIFVANAIVGTLQRAARQVSSASERFGVIASQQSSGSTQQVWAINAINQALQSLAETATDISRRTDQLAQMGNQILQRRAEISPTQIDSIVAYITRSVRDISVASRHQTSTYERMTGAMQAVMEVAQQVANDSQQTSENAERLEQVVHQLRQLVGVSRRAMLTGATSTSAELRGGGRMAPSAAGGARSGRTVQAVRPERGRRSGRLPSSRPDMAGVGGTTQGVGQSGGLRRGARPVSDTGMGSLVPRGVGSMPGTPGQYPGAMPQQPNPWGTMPSSGFGGGTSPYGTPPRGAWNVPAPTSGPGPAPWASPGPNSGPNSGGFRPGGGSEVAPGGDRRRFGANSPNSGPARGSPDGQRLAGMPPLDGPPDGSTGWSEGNTGFPWNRGE